MGSEEVGWAPCKPTEIMPTAVATPAGRAAGDVGRMPSAGISYKLVDRRFRGRDARSNIEALRRVADGLAASSPLRHTVAWPREMLVCNGEWRGYAVPKFPFARNLGSLCADAGVSAMLRVNLAFEMAEMAMGLHKAGVVVGDFDLNVFAFEAKERRLVLADPGAMRVISPDGAAVGRGGLRDGFALVDDDVRLAEALLRMLSSTELASAQPLAGLFAASFSDNALDVPSAAEYAAALQGIAARGFAQCECGTEFSRAVSGRVCPSCGRVQRGSVATHFREPMNDAFRKLQTGALLYAEGARRFAMERMPR